MNQIMVLTERGFKIDVEDMVSRVKVREFKL